MTAQASIPLKWYVPFAQNDSARVELPVTTTDSTRASQSLGFPPLTMQPPESGGVAPEGEDFNGGMNQIARIAWWILNGGGWPYDATFAANSNINGYPNGATLQAADLRGSWISTADNNQHNPDTDGTNWVPGFQYGVTAITGLTNANVTLTPAQAAKDKITLAGTLTGNVQIIFPTWTTNWTISNGAILGSFTITAKTASGAGVALVSGYQKVLGNGTDIIQPPESIAAAVLSTQPAQFGQVSGVVGSARNLSMRLDTASASATMTAAEIIVETALGGMRVCLPNFSKTINLATTGANGMDTGSAPVSGFVALYAIYNPTTQTGALLGADATSAVVSDVYGGTHMPSGYTYSGLISVWPTNSSGQFIPGLQTDRFLSCYSSAAGQALNSSVTQSSPTALSISSLVPKNAKIVSGNLQIASTASSTEDLSVYPTSGTFGIQGNLFAAAGSSATISQPYSLMQLSNPQTLYYTATNTAGTPTFQIFVAAYGI